MLKLPSRFLPAQAKALSEVEALSYLHEIEAILPVEDAFERDYARNWISRLIRAFDAEEVLDLAYSILPAVTATHGIYPA